MLTLLCLVAIVFLLAAHELLLVRARTSRFAPGGARLILLLGLVVAAVAFGSRAQLSTRLQSALSAWTPDVAAAFELSGDPFLQRALEAQEPAYPFPAGGSGEDVRDWQQHVATELRARAGWHPAGDATVPVEVLQTERVGTVQRTLIRFTSWDGTTIPAYVHQPLEGRDLGGVLVIPGHGGGIRATSGIVSDYQRAVALELARRGYVTLTPELRGFGLLTRHGAPSHRAVAFAALEAGSFYKAIVGRDLSLALTVLERWDAVDPSRLAVAGTSLGAELAVFLAALDPRPRVIVSHSYGGGLGPSVASESITDEARQTPHGCHTIPGVNRLLWREDWFRLVAPRAIQVVRGVGDIAPHRDAAAFSAAGSAGHERQGAPDRFEFLVEPGRHEFFIEPAARFLAAWL